MGRGIEVRESSIRLRFSLKGKMVSRTLVVNGEPMPPTQANLRYAERLMRDIRAAIRLGEFRMADFFQGEGVAEGSTVEAQLNDWLDAQRIAPSTKAGYASAVKFWAAAIGDKPLPALRTSHILKALADRPDLTGKTVNNYVSVLREAMELAVTDRLLADNPVQSVKRAKHQKDPPDPFSREESDRILDAIGARYPGQVHNMVEFWFWTGLRTSEMFALRWTNVDLASGTVLVAEANVRGNVKATKTNTARTVKLNSRALAAINRQRAFTQMSSEHVFHDPRYDSAWVDERAFRRSFWTPTLKALGIRYRRPYNMRHSYATAMLMAGMTPAFCAKQLGHSVEMFLRTYSKWLDGMANDLEMARLEDSLKTKTALELPQRSREA
jgi:integrase